MLPALIDAAYELFAPYTVGATLDVCKVCCVSDAEEQRLLGTPLRTVSAAVLDAGYFSSARSGSEREYWELKHFLPRLLELVTQFDFPMHSTEITFSRLDLHLPTQWTGPERALLQTFAEVFFARCVGQYPLPGGASLTELLIMFGLGHFDLTELLAAWAAARSSSSALHAKDFLLHEIRFGRANQHRLQNPFSEPHINAAVAAWLNTAGVSQLLAQQLESQLLHDSDLSNDELNELSWAYEVLQTELL
ncbi:hypothetical protein [Hymenobacter negativus]|uniref:Uncharacterized protein n=1 Tax=Hymenobacter negativus TaxID=2795026 RepID=A0ABS3QBS8_9BACT|nr:hypothetical protein [Hymenobacter negativus]MBO2008712.1 hypothetical protein [Hymenobacter negativus]